MIIPKNILLKIYLHLLETLCQWILVKTEEDLNHQKLVLQFFQVSDQLNTNFPSNYQNFVL